MISRYSSFMQRQSLTQDFPSKEMTSFKHLKKFISCLCSPGFTNLSKGSTEQRWMLMRFQSDRRAHFTNSWPHYPKKRLKMKLKALDLHQMSTIACRSSSIKKSRKATLRKYWALSSFYLKMSRARGSRDTSLKLWLSM